MSRRQRSRRSARLPINTFDSLESRRLLSFGIESYPIIPVVDDNTTQEIAAGSDGNLWFPEAIREPDGFQVGFGVFNPKTATEVDSALGRTFGEGPIAAGPDGKLWFVTGASQGQETVASIDPISHDVTQYFNDHSSVPISTFNGLAFDGAGKLWLIDTVNGHVFKFDPATENFAVFGTPPRLFGQPFGITEGPAGSIWFTDKLNGVIATIDPATNQVTEFPAGGTSPASITLGPGGDLFYTLGSAPGVSGAAIGDFNPLTHQTKVYPVPDEPVAITVGPGSDLTFACSTQRLGVLDPSSGQVTELVTGTGPLDGTPVTLTTDATGDPWHLSFSAVGSNSIGHVVDLVDSQTQLEASSAATMVGQPVTLTATVTTPAGTGGATGSVMFIGTNSGGETVDLGTVPLNGAGVSTFSESATAGTMTVTAQYLGDSKFGQSTSNSLTLTASQIPTTTTSVVTPSSVFTGHQVVLIATVRDDLGNPVNDGHVTFFDVLPDGRSIGFGPYAVNNGEAEVTIHTGLPGVTNLVSAEFEDDQGKYASSSSPVSRITTAPLPTSVALITNLDSQAQAQPITFRAMVSTRATDLTPPATGNVFFYDGTSLLGVAKLSTTDVAALTVSSLSPGMHAISAVYQGDSNHGVATSNSVTERISADNATTTVLYPSAALVPEGARYQFTVTVTSACSAAAVPTGLVTLYEDGRGFDSAPLNSSGQAVFSYVATGPTSTHTFFASYLGDFVFASSVSNTVTETLGIYDGPLVNAVVSSGSALHSRSIVIDFNEPLYQQTAENVSNYKIVATMDSSLRAWVTTAVYNTAERSVTLTLRSPIRLSGRFNLIIAGTGYGGLTDTSGRQLDGRRTGLPGSDFLINLNKRTVRAADAHTTPPRAWHSHPMNRA